MDPKLLAWNWARPLGRLDPSDWRRDRLGNLIRFGDYGDRSSVHGWEVELSDENGPGQPEPRAVHWSRRAEVSAEAPPRSRPRPVEAA